MRSGLLFLVTVWLFRLSQACVDIPDYFGTLDSSLIIASSTLTTSSTSCNCCGLCHQNPACKSFSFGTTTKECVLYGKIGNYVSLARERQDSHSTQYFIMPFSSQTNEFCHSDADCLTAGDSCRGRICTSDPIVTCRDLYLLNSALPDHRYWGYVDGRELKLYCRMEGEYAGATLLLASQDPPTDGVQWSTENILDKVYDREDYPNEDTDYSILR